MVPIFKVMTLKDKRRLLRKWEKQRLALKSKIESVLAERSTDEVAIQRFTINWETAGINLFSTGCDEASRIKQRQEIKEATQKCQPEVSELAVAVDRAIKEQQRLYLELLGKSPKPKWPKCFVEANRSLAGMRN